MMIRNRIWPYCASRADAGMRLRLLQHDDAAALASLHTACFTQRPWSEQGFKALLQTGAEGLGAFAEDGVDHSVLAFLMIRRAVDEAEILSLATSPAYRRNGLAGQLLQRMLEILLQQGITRLFLEVQHDNHAALRLYEQAGFRQIARRRDYYRHADGSFHDALVMERLV
jgi:ribosomal-protein-alanine N-acetyltransferase